MWKQKFLPRNPPAQPAPTPPTDSAADAAGPTPRRRQIELDQQVGRSEEEPTSKQDLSSVYQVPMVRTGTSDTPYTTFDFFPHHKTIIAEKNPLPIASNES